MAVHPDEYRMSFGDHLEELRGRMVRATVGIVLAALVTFYYGKDFVSWLTEPLNRAQIAAGLPPQSITNSPMAAFFIYMKVAMIAALVLAAPWILFQMWKFVEAGLYSHERKVVFILAPFSSLMVVLAIAFMYYVMLPITLTFLLVFAVGFGPAGGQSKDPIEFLTKMVSKQAGSDAEKDKGKDGDSPEPKVVENPPRANPNESFGQLPTLEEDPAEPHAGQVWINLKQNALKVHIPGKEGGTGKTLVAYLAVSSLVSPLIDLQQYIDFVLFMTLGIALAFQMPVAMTVLGWTGIVQSGMISKYRKHMLFVCFCLGAIITPSSDPVSMSVMALPLYILFELGLLIMYFTQRNRAEEDEEEDDDEDEEEDDETDEDDEDEDDEDDEEGDAAKA
jgi:sec-independent protein translocase protein TatC